MVVLDGEVRRAREALVAARAQTHPRTEVLAVAADERLLGLARAAAAADARVRVVEAPGCDRARARAFGAVAAHGAWLLFLAPGQVLRRDAVARLRTVRARTPAEHGAVLGGLAGAGPEDSWARTPLLGRLLVTQERWARTLDDAEPDGQTAATALLARGHARADAVVVHDVPDRPGWWGSGGDPALALSERVAQDRASLALLEREDQVRHRRLRAAGALARDLPAVLAVAELLEGPQWRLLSSHAAELLAVADLDEVPLRPRVAAWLAAQDRREDLVTVVAAWRAAGDRLPTEVVQGRVLALVDGLTGVDGLPPEARELAPAETALAARVVATRVEGPDLLVELHAGVRHVEASAPGVRLSAVGAGAVTLDDLPVELGEDPEVTAWLGEPHQRHDAGVVRTRLPLAPLGRGEWRLRVEVTDGGVTRVGTARGTVSAARPLARVAGRVPAHLSAWEQRRLQESYAASTGDPDPRLLLVVPTREALVSDAEALAARWPDRVGPGARVLWAVADPGAGVPSWAEPVPVRTPGWYAALAEAGWVVTDHDDVLGTLDTAAGAVGDGWYAPRPGQRVVRTTTGGPGPARGLARWRRLGLVPSHVEQLLATTSGRWTHALAPTPALARLVSEDWAYDGPLLALGRPGADLLLGADGAARRAATRAGLGVGEGETAVLWATTCRDDVTGSCLAASGGRGPDPARVARLLGPGHVLLRVHPHCGDHDPGDHAARVLEVAARSGAAGPPVADLVLASDAGVLDFSPLRHDLALAGRPAVAWVPDLEDHVERVGELVDLPASTAGPAPVTTEEVVAALGDVADLAHRWEGRRRDLVDHFCGLDDGAAADRVLSALLEDTTTRR